MFHVDVTLEDSRIIAYESDRGAGFYYTCFYDNISGKVFAKTITAEDLAKILMVGISGDDSEIVAGFKYNETFDPIFEDCPLECRPIP